MRNRKQPSWLQTASKGKKRVLAAVCILLVLGVLSPFVINGIVVGSARRYILEPQETEQVNADCVIALGAMVWGKDTLSHMLEDRVLGAIDVYERGGAKKILMSGDHGQEDYDEVNAMKKYAVEKGVAADDVFMDHAGFSTYETMYRARDVFQAKRSSLSRKNTICTARFILHGRWGWRHTALRLTRDRIAAWFITTHGNS